MVYFETVQPLNLVIYRIGYAVSGTNYVASDAQSGALLNWLVRAYPINLIRYCYRDHWFGNATVDARGRLTAPDADAVNAILESKRIWDWFYPAWPEILRALYYGMVPDGGGFMQGKAAGIPAHVASGPTGSTATRFTWDTDGNYGDWYGAHELGHALGRRHPGFCGQSRDPQHPSGDYPNGRISPSMTGTAAMYGFDTGTGQIYPPDWHDVMTYCDFQ